MRKLLTKMGLTLCLTTALLFTAHQPAAANAHPTSSFQVAGLTFSSPTPTTLTKTAPKFLTFALSPTQTLSLKKTQPTSDIAKLLLVKIPSPSQLSEPTPTKKIAQITSPVIEVEKVAKEELVTLTPTVAITPVLAANAAQTPTPTSLSNGGLNAEKLFQMANNHRASIGKAPFEKHPLACQLAAERAPEIGEEIVNGHMHSGMYGRNLPYWNTENIITMRTEEEAFTWWLNDYIHRIAIEGDYKYSCVACHNNDCAQEFTNFQPK